MATPITYRGRQYFTTRRTDALMLAAQLGIRARVEELQNNAAGQLQIDRALWEAILGQVGRGVLAGGES